MLEVQKELEEAQESLSSLNAQSDEYTETLEVFGELQHKLENLDAFRMKSNVERVLMGLGFAVKDLDRMTEEFSGGWQMRIELAKLLLREPSVLLLDEPTNHLDLDTLQWLEEYLKKLPRRRYPRLPPPVFPGQPLLEDLRPYVVEAGSVFRKLLVL